MEFIKKNYKYPQSPPSPQSIKKNLGLLSKFKRRNTNLKITISEKNLLSFKTTGNEFTVTNCFTEYLTNTLRLIECSIGINEEGKPLSKEKSFFKLDQNHKLIFMNESSKHNFGKKEEAIFYYLINHFNKECSYTDIFTAVKKYCSNDQRLKQMLDRDRAGYIRDGIDEIRTKLYKESGYRDSIETLGGRNSIFRLIY
jgi:hypothetical protein